MLKKLFSNEKSRKIFTTSLIAQAGTNAILFGANIFFDNPFSDGVILEGVTDYLFYAPLNGLLFGSIYAFRTRKDFHNKLSYTMHYAEVNALRILVNPSGTSYTLLKQPTQAIFNLEDYMASAVVGVPIGILSPFVLAYSWEAREKIYKHIDKTRDIRREKIDSAMDKFAKTMPSLFYSLEERVLDTKDSLNYGIGIVKRIVDNNKKSSKNNPYDSLKIIEMRV